MVHKPSVSSRMGSVLSVVVLSLAMFSLGVGLSPVIAEPLSQSPARSPLSADASLHAAQDRLNEDQIKVFSDRVVLELSGAKYAQVAPTSSMLPFLHSGSHTLEVQPESESDLSVGDVISFYVKEKQAYVVHAITEIGSDNDGWYAKTKGFNNPGEDPWTVRFNDIQGVLVGVLY